MSLQFSVMNYCLSVRLYSTHPGQKHNTSLSVFLVLKKEIHDFVITFHHDDDSFGIAVTL